MARFIRSHTMTILFLELCYDFFFRHLLFSQVFVPILTNSKKRGNDKCPQENGLMACF